MVIVFIAAHTNTGASTLNVTAIGTALGAIPIKKQGGTQDVAAGDIPAGAVIFLIHDGTNFQMLSALGNGSSGGGGGSLLLKTNGASNGSQALLNQVAGPGITLTDDGSGDVTIRRCYSDSNVTRSKYPQADQCFTGEFSPEFSGQS